MHYIYIYIYIYIYVSICIYTYTYIYIYEKSVPVLRFDAESARLREVSLRFFCVFFSSSYTYTRINIHKHMCVCERERKGCMLVSVYACPATLTCPRVYVVTSYVHEWGHICSYMNEACRIYICKYTMSHTHTYDWETSQRREFGDRRLEGRKGWGGGCKEGERDVGCEGGVLLNDHVLISRGKQITKWCSGFVLFFWTWRVQRVICWYDSWPTRGKGLYVHRTLFFCFSFESRVFVENW